MLWKQLPLGLILFEESPNQFFILGRNLREYYIVLERFKVIRFDFVFRRLLILLFFSNFFGQKSNIRSHCLLDLITRVLSSKALLIDIKDGEWLHRLPLALPKRWGLILIDGRIIYFRYLPIQLIFGHRRIIRNINWRLILKGICIWHQLNLFVRQRFRIIKRELKVLVQGLLFPWFPRAPSIF